ncbi:MAG: hypothetical protein PHF21_02190 [Bacilli bacterium]|nr:hypothetical protein [Bacilli bacterium]
MDTVIREINESLLKIINELESRQQASHKELENVNIKINEKVDEAKDYKIEVDNAKSKIKKLEQEIESLEKDLSDLNERFGKKDLNAILEAGHKEINSKIMEKQNLITKQRQKIGELADRARSIKDLLINLKKDKIIKEEKLNIINKAYDYYNDSLTKIIDYAKNNPKNLNSYDLNYSNLNYDYSNEPLTEVFDEIESMDDDSIKEKSEIQITEEDDLSKEEESNLNNIFDKLREKSLDFDEIDKSIDREYEEIFGREEPDSFDKEESENLDITENDLNTPVEDVSQPNIFDEINKSVSEEIKLPDIFGNEAPINQELEIKPEIDSLFKEYNLDFNKFVKEDQELINNIFVYDQFQKVLAILQNNHIDLNKIYTASSLFEKLTPEELDQILTKLLLTGQTTSNIELILDSLGDITSANLTEIVNNYGPEIKDANIAEIIMKSKKLAGNISVIDKPIYLQELGFTEEEITIMESSINRDNWEIIVNFPELIMVNYSLLNNLEIGNIKEVFMNHAHMFILNPDKFKSIFAKYDQSDLVRCIEKNAAVIEKL